jgi:hypothetical protein
MTKSEYNLTTEIDRHVKKLSELVEKTEGLSPREKSRLQKEIDEMQVTLEELRAKRRELS